MYNEIIKEINLYIKENGLKEYIKDWKEIEKKSKFKDIEEFKTHLQQKIKKYHKHSFIIEKNTANLIQDQKLPKFIWDNKNKIGRIVFYKYIMCSDNYQNSLSENLIVFNTKYNLNLWKTENIKGLIIDLRFHSGGNFFPFTKALVSILGTTSLFAWKNKKANFTDKCWINITADNNIIDEQNYLGKEIKFKGKIAVLISNKTASAGEFAASIFKGRKNVKFFLYYYLLRSKFHTYVFLYYF